MQVIGTMCVKLVSPSWTTVTGLICRPAFAVATFGLSRSTLTTSGIACHSTIHFGLASFRSGRLKGGFVLVMAQTNVLPELIVATNCLTTVVAMTTSSIHAASGGLPRQPHVSGPAAPRGWRPDDMTDNGSYHNTLLLSFTASACT